MSEENTTQNAENAVQDAAKPSNYNAANIQVLEGMEAVRKRPAMYIGDTGERGYHHLVYEVVDNSIDEALAGYCTNIDVVINADGSLTVQDNGRGIPVDMHPTQGKPAIEVVLTVLHAGGKFDGSNYKVSGGLHGVGVSCVNALSDWMKVEVKRAGKIHQIEFSRGHVTKPLEIVGECGEIFGEHSDAAFTVRTFDFKEKKYKEERVDARANPNDVHGGGDEGLMTELCEYLLGDTSSFSITKLDDSIYGHFAVYAAEKSRKEGIVVDIRREYSGK